MKKHYRHENDCLNCGTQLEGKFCHHCGQENLQIKENFGHLMNHAISDYFHFDHQFFHTLKPLLFQPGKLTNEYMAGRRVQYLHPIKMYIFISLIFFILIFKHNQEEKKDDIKNLNNAEKAAILKKKLDANPNLTDLQKKVIESAALNGENVKIDSSAKKPGTSTTALTFNKDTLVKINTNKVSAVQKPKIKNPDTTIQAGLTTVNVKKHKSKHKDNDDDEDDNSFFTRLFDNSADSTYEDYQASQLKLPAAERDGFFERMAIRKQFAYKQYGSRAKEVFTDELKHNVPKMMFVLLPLFALILRFAFWRNHKFYVEHLIFSFHLHCFLFLFLAIVMLINMLPNVMHLHGWADFAAVVGITLYIYKALKAVYQRSRFRTISKMIGISFVYFFVFTFCMLGLVLITAVTAV
ncbi:DUF3667 domain-containing protein [Mucilaginibacter jinjuensis]|uniref:DUF3667 domain-containing protein n=1 Tax=Mucilaginibacter jinjuensis TaxID=1176721 RepID=A0ABY7T2W1_9SPHI|nr:DUF3667 domain-containing protein [Mucilaginibacter jinjuensis]WCT10525.1 DUF3667 domain-containing protein [Mucilaginibacter jinjuensis]